MTFKWKNQIDKRALMRYINRHLDFDKNISDLIQYLDYINKAPSTSK
jgi:hypothetical protein